MATRRRSHAKEHSLLLATLLALVPSMLVAQVCDDFSDGDFSSNPAWNGDTSHFRINSSHQLQLYSGGEQVSQLAFRYLMPTSDTVEWRFWMRLGFSPTANNNAVVALCADAADITAARHSLSIAITDPASGDKSINIYQDSTLLFTFPYHPRLSNNKLRFSIRMVGRQRLLMVIDTIGDTDSVRFADCGTVALVSDSLPDSAYFVIRCRYTSSRARLFFFDDITINSDGCDNGEPNTRKPQPDDIVINEILFDPETGGAEYVELYNRSDRTLALAQLFLATVRDDSITRLYPIADGGTMPPHSLFAVTTDAQYVSSRYTVPCPDCLLQVAAMPSYNNKAGSAVVATADSIVLDRLDYDVSMHSRLLRDKKGVALERRSADRPTQEAANWFSAASTAGYGTPTGRNSQSKEFLFADNDFTVSSTLFSPDGDGYNDLLDITYNIELCDLAANIAVYDRQGRALRTLARGQLLGCQGVLVWDGTDDGGRSCPRGKYLIVVEAYNENGARQSWRRTVSLVRQWQ